MSAATVDFGPQAEAVQAILDRFATLTTDEKQQLRDLRNDAFWAGWNVAVDGRADRAGLDAARDALFVRLFDWYDVFAACSAALAVLLRHTFTEAEREHYEALTRPWVTVTGLPAHPDDVESPVRHVAATSATDELAALSAMVELFGPLDDDARSRIIHYLGDRFKVSA